MFTTHLFNLYIRNIFKTSLYIYIFQDEKCRLLRNLSLFMVWNLCLTLDVEKLENVQKKALKQVNGFQETDYLIRVKELGLFTQEERRTYTNLQNHSWNRWCGQKDLIWAVSWHWKESNQKKWTVPLYSSFQAQFKYKKTLFLQ